MKKKKRRDSKEGYGEEKQQQEEKNHAVLNDKPLIVLYWLFALFSINVSFLSLRIFFFSSRRRHTICYRDWSSDVCSSDLTPSSPSPRTSTTRSARRPRTPA